MLYIVAKLGWGSLFFRLSGCRVDQMSYQDVRTHAPTEYCPWFGSRGLSRGSKESNAEINFTPFIHRTDNIIIIGRRTADSRLTTD